VDWVFPFHHTLVLAEGWRNVVDEGDATTHAGLGVRTQLSPFQVFDLGTGRNLARPDGGDGSSGSVSLMSSVCHGGVAPRALRQRGRWADTMRLPLRLPSTASSIRFI
jgi:hypothetical protein